MFARVYLHAQICCFAPHNLTDFDTLTTSHILNFFLLYRIILPLLARLGLRSLVFIRNMHAIMMRCMRCFKELPNPCTEQQRNFKSRTYRSFNIRFLSC